MKQEHIYNAQLLEQESNQLNQQIELLDQNINEITQLKMSISELQSLNKEKILIDIGKKIYLPVNLDEKELIIEIGNDCYVKKSFNDAIKLIDEQLIKIKNAKEMIVQDLNKVQENVDRLIKKIEFEKDLE